jgi:hypothetical protein
MLYIVRDLYTKQVLFEGTYEECNDWARRNPPAPGGCNHVLPAEKADLRYHLEYQTTSGHWVRAASYPTMEAATSAHFHSAVIHKRVTWGE